MGLRYSFVFLLYILAFNPALRDVDGFKPSPSSMGFHTCLQQRTCANVALSSVVLNTTEELSLTSSSTASDTKSKYLLEAENFKKRAQQLLAEARSLEAEIEAQKVAKSRRGSGEELIETLFTSNSTPSRVSDNIRQRRLTPEKLELVLDALYDRLVVAQGKGSQSSVNASKAFQIGDADNSAETDSFESDRLEKWIGMLLEAAQILDNEHLSGSKDVYRWNNRVHASLKAHLHGLRKADEEALERQEESDSSIQGDDEVRSYIRRALGVRSQDGANATRVGEQWTEIPPWIPTSLVPAVLSCRDRLDPKDLTTLNNEVLMGSGFFVTSKKSVPNAAIFMGNLRNRAEHVKAGTPRNGTKLVFQEIYERMETCGLSERVQLFFLNDIDAGFESRREFPKPMVLAVPRAVVVSTAKPRNTLFSKVLAGSVTLCSLFFSFSFAVSTYALNPRFFDSVINQHDLSRLTSCIPLFLGCLGIQALHELAHLVAAKKHKIQVGLPMLLPSEKLGFFGCITPFKSFLPHRTALLDFALSGPAVGILASIALMIGGVCATVTASSDALSRFPVVPVALMKGSFFVGCLMSLLVPKVMLLSSPQPVPIHPAFLVGFVGLITNSLNMLPIGRLDGGRVCSAIFGARSAALASFAALLIVFLSAENSAIAFTWFLLVTFFQRKPEFPPRDDVTHVGDVRVSIYLVAFAVSFLSLLPFPGGQGYL